MDVFKKLKLMQALIVTSVRERYYIRQEYSDSERERVLSIHNARFLRLAPLKFAGQLKYARLFMAIILQYKQAT